MRDQLTIDPDREIGGTSRGTGTPAFVTVTNAWIGWSAGLPSTRSSDLGQSGAGESRCKDESKSRQAGKPGNPGRSTSENGHLDYPCIDTPRPSILTAGVPYLFEGIKFVKEVTDIRASRAHLDGECPI